MNCPLELAKPLACWLVTFGCVLALVSAFEPEATGAWHLVAGYLVLGLIPYIDPTQRAKDVVLRLSKCHCG
jgi:hypothetical protein